jgi:hypothetical protein
MRGRLSIPTFFCIFRFQSRHFFNVAYRRAAPIGLGLSYKSELGLPMQSIQIPSRALYRQLSPLLPQLVDRQDVDHSPRAAPERRRCLHPLGHSKSTDDLGANPRGMR